MASLSKHVLGLGSCRSFKRRWLRFDVIEDLLDYVWVSDGISFTFSSVNGYDHKRGMPTNLNSAGTTE